MNIRSISTSELCPELLGHWHRIRAQDSELASPFFAAEFVQAVGRHRTDVEIGLLEDEGRVAGFFPFQRTPGNGAVPVGNRLNDFHGVLVEPSSQTSADTLLKGLKLRDWSFHHQIATQQIFARYFFEQHPSPRVDLTSGFDAYYQQRSATHRRTFKDQRKRWRRLETHLVESGLAPLRFEFDLQRPALLDQLFQWKTDQYRRTEQPDVFSFSWTRHLLHDLLTLRDSNLSGVLSALFAGDRPIALHFGLRSREAFHCWFPAYDVAFRRWSPGLQLWVKLIEAASREGIRQVDFGSGPEAFKHKLANANTVVATGMASQDRLHNLCRQTWHHTAGWLAGTRLKQPLRRVTGGLVSAWKSRALR